MSKVYSWRKLNEKELTRVYLDEMRRDFPPTELKPLSMILNSEADGTAHTWGVFDGETLAAYLLMVRPHPRSYQRQNQNHLSGVQRHPRTQRQQVVLHRSGQGLMLLPSLRSQVLRAR